ncbi:MAG: type III secretion system chaperone [Rhabdochlamydiaceae bacterium]|nr:type III secretion system chaperone [Rhabdochlamydiaceae bacterium]
MLETYIPQLFKEFGLQQRPFEKDGSVLVEITSYLIEMVKLDPGVRFSAKIAPVPTKEKEEFLLKLMQANFLGQGTGGATLGLKEDESFLTLSLSLPYEMNYMAFKDAVEEFVNYLEYWRAETARHEKEARMESK